MHDFNGTKLKDFISKSNEDFLQIEPIIIGDNNITGPVIIIPEKPIDLRTINDSAYVPSSKSREEIRKKTKESKKSKKKKAEIVPVSTS
ncbi:hypothetical protein HZS_7193 [Henneguya salminicola]|nr:hypothetical protein HZS_7193 [Henneguya salminicola]